MLTSTIDLALRQLIILRGSKVNLELAGSEKAENKLKNLQRKTRTLKMTEIISEIRNCKMKEIFF